MDTGSNLGINGAAAQAETGQLLAQAQSGAMAKGSGKIEKAARDFEAILLGSWLQKAEASFGSVPGGDDEDGDDPGKDQFQGIAMQALGGSLADSGGIGIAKMIAEHLQAAAGRGGGGSRSEQAGGAIRKP